MASCSQVSSVKTWQRPLVSNELLVERAMSMMCAAHTLYWMAAACGQQTLHTKAALTKWK
jgi:hypothetical protein